LKIEGIMWIHPSRWSSFLSLSSQRATHWISWILWRVCWEHRQYLNIPVQFLNPTKARDGYFWIINKKGILSAIGRFQDELEWANIVARLSKNVCSQINVHLFTSMVSKNPQSANLWVDFLTGQNSIWQHSSTLNGKGQTLAQDVDHHGARCVGGCSLRSCTGRSMSAVNRRRGRFAELCGIDHSTQKRSGNLFGDVAIRRGTAGYMPGIAMCHIVNRDNELRLALWIGLNWIHGVDYLIAQ
jgi:hypothetical protein